MARLARVVAVDVPHHVTQRGNARQFILASGRVAPAFLLVFLSFTTARGAGCPTLYGEARSCFLRFGVKGGIRITVHAKRFAPISRFR